MVAGPHAIDRPVENPLATLDRQRRAPVHPAANEDVIEPSKRPVGVGEDGVVAHVRRPFFLRVGGFPGIAVTDARAEQGLPSGPEADARRVGRIGQVPGHDDVDPSLPHQLFDEQPSGFCLQLPLILEGELPAR